MDEQQEEFGIGLKECVVKACSRGWYLGGTGSKQIQILLSGGRMISDSRQIPSW